MLKADEIENEQNFNFKPLRYNQLHLTKNRAAKTVGNYLKELEAAGFLTSEKVGKEKLYLNFRLMHIFKNPE